MGLHFERAELFVDGHKVLVHARRHDYRQQQRDYDKKTRVYGAEKLSPELNAEMERWCFPTVESVPFRKTDEKGHARDLTAEEAAREAEITDGYRRSRRKATGDVNKKLPGFVQSVIDELRISGSAVRIDGSQRKPITSQFSTKAGCSCPCSPGWILSSRITVDGAPVDVTLPSPAAA